MQFIAPTGAQSLRTLEKHRTPTRVPVIVISRGGHAYRFLEVQS
jgi:hypothetical protein